MAHQLDLFDHTCFSLGHYGVLRPLGWCPDNGPFLSGRVSSPAAPQRSERSERGRRKGGASPPILTGGSGLG